MLTYISIGFCGKLIYTEASFGVDHNMLLARGEWTASGPLIRGLVAEMARILNDVRTLATNCCHIRTVRVGPAECRASVLSKGRREERRLKIGQWEHERNNSLPGFTTNYTISANCWSMQSFYGRDTRS